MKKLFILFALLFPLGGVGGFIYAQNTDLSPNGVFVPRLTTAQRDALTPTAGQLIYNNDISCFNVYQSTGWQSICGTDPSTLNTTQQGNTFNGASQLVKLDASGNLSSGIKITTPAFTSLPASGTGSLQNDWVNYGGTFATAGYYKDSRGQVFLKGLIKNGTITTNTTLFTLPTGFRPSETLIFDCLTYDNANAKYVIGRIDIQTNGNVTIQSGFNFFMTLDAISFRANGN
jgi:hypothetical protein